MGENRVPKTDRRFDAIVAGGGPAALALSLAAAHAGGRVLRLGKDSGSGGRHYALGLRARNFLRNIGAEVPESAAVNRFWLFSGGRKAEVCAEESGLESLCNVVSETALLDSLRARAAEKGIPNVAASPDSISDLQSGENGATIRADGKKFRASLIAAADGSRSRLAELRGVGVCARAFGQAALSVLVRAPLPSDVAAQWFGRGDVLALLPVSESDFGAGVFSLIWSLPEDAAQRLAKEGEGGGVGGAVARRTGLEGVEVLGELGGGVGGVGGRGGVGVFPLWSVRRAVRVSGRVVFVGDGARVIHPLAGQGLNLALRDAEDLICRVSRFSDWGNASALSSHATSRILRTETLHRATRFFAECGEGRGDRNINGGKHLPPGPPRRGPLRKRLLTLARHLADDAVGEAGGGGDL